MDNLSLVNRIEREKMTNSCKDLVLKLKRYVFTSTELKIIDREIDKLVNIKALKTLKRNEERAKTNKFKKQEVKNEVV